MRNQVSRSRTVSVQGWSVPSISLGVPFLLTIFIFRRAALIILPFENGPFPVYIGLSSLVRRKHFLSDLPD